MKLVLSILFLLNQPLLFAEEVYTDPFLKVSKIEIHELIENEDGSISEKNISRSKDSEKLERLIKNSVPTKSSVVGVIMTTKKLVALGRDLYKIVKEGKPVVDIELAKPISVLPANEGLTISPLDLDNWSIPKSKNFRVRVKNHFGMETVLFDFMLIFSAQGKYEGKGNYITGAQIRPTNIKVNWGWDLEASFNVQTITNQGTEEDVIAGALLNLDYGVSTTLQHIQNSTTIYINGLGEIVHY